MNSHLALKPAVFCVANLRNSTTIPCDSHLEYNAFESQSASPRLNQRLLNIWPMMFAVFACIVFFSIFVDVLNTAAIVIARIMGVLSLMGLLLLLLAGTIGGNFHLSHSNQIVAVGLAGMALLGCAFFFLRIRPPHSQTHVSDKQQPGNRG